MRWTTFGKHLLWALLLFGWCAAGTAGADSGPTLNDGRKWRIGYYEGGPFSDYTDTMRTLIQGLVALGWIREPGPGGIDGNMHARTTVAQDHGAVALLCQPVSRCR